MRGLSLSRPRSALTAKPSRPVLTWSSLSDQGGGGGNARALPATGWGRRGCQRHVWHSADAHCMFHPESAHLLLPTPHQSWQAVRFSACSPPVSFGGTAIWGDRRQESNRVAACQAISSCRGFELEAGGK